LRPITVTSTNDRKHFLILEQVLVIQEVTNMSAPDAPAPKGATLPLTHQPVGTRIELSSIATM
jgi:hypothetical protein